MTVTRSRGTTISYDMTPAVSKEQLEKSVSSLVSDASGATVDSVTCDSGLEGKKGAEAHCDVTVGGGTTMQRTVDVTKVDGLLMNFTLIPVLPKDQVQESLLGQLAEQLGERPDSAECSENPEGKPGNTIDCTVVAGSESQEFTLTVNSVDGDRINYSYAPKADPPGKAIQPGAGASGLDHLCPGQFVVLPCFVGLLLIVTAMTM